MAKKRVVITGDPHCGHHSGLTPPSWWLNPSPIDGEAEPTRRRRQKWGTLQRECWGWTMKQFARLQPIDLLIVAGDCIEGKGARSGGTELLTADRNDQVDMACEVIRRAKAKKVAMVRGTGYHDGQDDDWEDQNAERVGASIGDHEWYEVNGVVLDVKHHIGSSSIPHGRATPILRDGLWNAVWHEHEEQPRGDILIRAHVHYHVYTGGIRAGRPWLAMTLPALQGMGSKYGARRCSGHVDFGFVHFDIDAHGGWQWQSHVAVIQAQKAQTLKF